ncbi:MAG: putative porin [Planctomycetes bacterium]|nr:putative porin [Planctomycetota bacterium]
MKHTSSTLIACIAGVALLSSNVNAQEQSDSPWSIYGDARVRAEFNDTEGGSDRHRMRMRLRAGAKYQASDSLMFNLRMVTGNSDNPNSVHQDAGDAFNTFNVSLDRLHFDYSMSEHVNVLFGKIGNPVFRNPVYGELVWDGDVSPEGIAFVSDYDAFDFSFGQYAVAENTNGQTEDAWMSVASINTTVNDFTVGGSYSFYGDMNGKGIEAGENRGNATSAADTYLSDFGVADVVLAYNLENITFSAELIENMRAADNVNSSGMAVGVSLKTDCGDKFYVQHQSIDQDAVFTGFSQDDTLNQATNYEGQIFGYKTKLDNGLGMHVWGMAVSQIQDVGFAGEGFDDIEYRFRIDFNLKF